LLKKFNVYKFGKHTSKAMSQKKLGFKETLLPEVIQTGKCASCGSCITNCPFNGLEFVNEKPTLVKDCKSCEICSLACPIYNWVLAKAENYVFNKERTPEDTFGIYREIVVAKAKNSDILKVAQEGGAATAMLVAALQNDLIDGAVVSVNSKEKPFMPIPVLATTTQGIMEAAGTKYSCSSTILALGDAVKQKKSKIALVGTPCQILAVRKMQYNNLKKTSGPVKYLIGLLCSECFDYYGLVETHIKGTLGINPSEILKINIKGKMFITTISGVTVIPLADVKQYVKPNCHICEDFSSELADISVGGLDLDGWTFVITRTEKGEELLANAEKAGLLEKKPLDDPFAMSLLLKLTNKKRNRAAVAKQSKS
jgi:coenzyme F420 hydrogenase subunit beta